MTEYETIFITKPDLNEAESKTVCEKVEGLCAADGLTFLALKDWGVKKTAYEVAKARRGHYYHLSFVGQGDVIPALERHLRHDERVVRFMTTRRGTVADVNARVEEVKAELAAAKKKIADAATAAAEAAEAKEQAAATTEEKTHE